MGTWLYVAVVLALTACGGAATHAVGPGASVTTVPAAVVTQLPLPRLSRAFCTPAEGQHDYAVLRPVFDRLSQLRRLPAQQAFELTIPIHNWPADYAQRYY